MSTVSEKNQFRRLIGDFNKEEVDDDIIESYLDDATRESTADFTNSARISEPVTDFDLLVVQYHPEIIYLAAITWWWDRAGELADRHSKSVGQTSEQSGDKFDRALQMIDRLQTRYDLIQTLGTDISMGNLSRFSKTTLSRLGGQSEEDALDAL